MIHIIVDFYEARVKDISTVDRFSLYLKKVFRGISSQNISEYFYQFRPFGVSGYVAYDNFSVYFHTYPEVNSVTFDFYIFDEECHSSIIELFCKKRADIYIQRMI